ncbi:glycosyltransferase family 4 protein [Winogradskyella wichelsiae]|uniref:glycosyltransferase family 4 protein n=1 Tax=Winogradskyella wichelsiae TaxID=2697007 RepID=UPI0015C6A6D3|nr:glycosyltransferase family 4 protein [Winogradskyella wichelsiae]
MELVRKCEIIYFLPDVAGGVTSVVHNLLKYRKGSDINYKVILTRLIERDEAHVSVDFEADETIVFTYSKFENLYSISKRLKNHISSSDSILVANDGLELRMVQLLKLPNKLIYIMHGDFGFYYNLIERNQGVIDQYIAISKFLDLKLKEKLNPENTGKISLKYFPVSRVNWTNIKSKSIDLIFVGALNERKGVQYLKPIYTEIQKVLPDVNLTIIGSGEFENKLKNQFKDNSNVYFFGQLNSNQVSAAMYDSKVLIFPSLVEGLPNVVVEAMKSFCVPVCSDLESGIPDLIEHEVTGFKIPIGDIEDFALHAISLIKDDIFREKIAVEAHNKVSLKFNPEQNAEGYENLIVNAKKSYKKYHGKTEGGILNQPYIPNTVVKIIRKLSLSPKL